MDPLAPIIERLQSEGRPRVWSLVMTVMGDSVQHHGGRIATGRLSRILGRIGIESGALRTALSRLARDGWVEGQRSGRTSSYTLTASGQAAVAPAANRIYAAPRQGPVAKWIFETGAKAGSGLPVSGGILRPAGRSVRETSGFGIVGQLTESARAAVAASFEPSHAKALRDLAADLDFLATLEPGAVAPLDALAARTLLIHRWRRLVLRWPEAPAEILPEPLTGRALDQEVVRAYAVLLPGAEAWLLSQQDDLAPLPAPDPGFAARFGGKALDLAGLPGKSLRR